MRRTHWIDVLTVSYTLLIVYGSLVPFDFDVTLPPTNAPTFLHIPVIRAGLPDVASNIALYFPLGFLLFGYLRRCEASLRAAVMTVVAAAGISLSMEFAQTFLISRFASCADVVSNLTGAVMGCLVYMSEFAVFRRLKPFINSELARNPAAVVAGAFGALVSLVALLPLDVTFDRSVITRAVRHAHLIPFDRVRELHARVNQQTLDFLPVSDLTATHLWQLRIDYLADVFLFFTLGLLVRRYLAARGGGRRRCTLDALVGTVVLAVLVTIAGLFVRSVGLDMTHAVTRSLGACLAAVLYQPILKSLFGPRAEPPPLDHPRTQHALTAAIALTAAYIAARQLAPFRFDADLLLTRLHAVEWMPFRSYTFAKLPQAALDASHKLARFLTLGSLMAWWWLAVRQRIGAREYALAGMTAAFATILLECAQCWLPGRVPAVTDVLVAGVATAVGVALGRTAHRWCRLATAVGAADSATQSAPILNVELPPPSADMPVEPHATPERTTHDQPDQRVAP